MRFQTRIVTNLVCCCAYVEPRAWCTPRATADRGPSPIVFGMCVLFLDVGGKAKVVGKMDAVGIEAGAKGKTPGVEVGRWTMDGIKGRSPSPLKVTTVKGTMLPLGESSAADDRELRYQ